MPELDKESESTLSLEQQLMQNLEGLAVDAEPTAETPEPEAAPEGDDAQPEIPSVEPPEGWSDELKSAFGSLDPQVQEMLVNDYTGLRENLSALESFKQTLEPVTKVIDPYREVFERNGQDFTPHLQQAVYAYLSFLQDPAGTLKRVAQQSNIDINSLVGDESDDEFTDPEVKALRDKIAQLEQRQTDQVRQATEAERQKALQTWEGFKSATDESGNLKHPHADKLETVMASFVQQGQTLDEAYESAKWTVPEIRERETKARLEAERKAKEQRTDKARRASSVLPPSDGSSPPKPDKTQFQNWEQAMLDSLKSMES